MHEVLMTRITASMWSNLYD